jgi:hypothetical protein
MHPECDKDSWRPPIFLTAFYVAGYCPAKIFFGLLSVASGLHCIHTRKPGRIAPPLRLALGG